jgi:hypothetical protein
MYFISHNDDVHGTNNLILGYVCVMREAAEKWLTNTARTLECGSEIMRLDQFTSFG